MKEIAAYRWHTMGSLENCRRVASLTYHQQNYIATQRIFTGFLPTPSLSYRNKTQTTLSN